MKRIANTIFTISNIIYSLISVFILIFILSYSLFRAGWAQDLLYVSGFYLINTFWYIFVVFFMFAGVGIVGKYFLHDAINKEELSYFAIVSLIFGHPVSGIMMLIMKEDELRSE